MPQDNISVASISPRAAKRPSRAAKVHRSGDVSYVHANAVRDNFSTDDFRLKTYAMSAALWVDHATGTLRAPWSLLAKPIAMPGKPPPRATAVRYMAELQRLGMFKLVHQGKSGGRDNNQWQFLWQCTNGTKDTAPTVPRSEGAVEQSEVEQSTPTVPKNGPTVPKNGPTVPRFPVGLDTTEYEIYESTPETPFEKSPTPKATAQKPTAEATPTSTSAPDGDAASKRAVEEMLAILNRKRIP